MPSLHERRAAFEPATANDAELTVRVIWSTGAAVARRDVRGPYLERLSLEPAAVDLSRLIGGPLLNSHRQFDLTDVLGTVLDAGVNGREGWATVRFSERHRELFKDVKAGIIRQVSVGYSVAEWRDETDSATGERVRSAVRWQPVELSFVPVGADAGATTRGAHPMPDSIESTTAAPAEDRAHVNTEIRTIAHVAGLGREWSDGLIDRGASAEHARAEAFREMARRSAPEVSALSVTIGRSADDPLIRAAAMGEALFARAHPKHTPSEPARQYIGLTIPEIARECLKRAGMSTTGLSPEGLIARAHTLSDYPLIFADTVQRELREVYAEGERGVLQAARQTTNRDFRAKSIVNFGDDAGLAKVGENGEFGHGTFKESGENLRLETYGRIYSYSRQMQVNDDLGALMRIPALFARSARELENSIAVDLLTSNSGNGPTMSDSKALFHTDHGNKAASGGSLLTANAMNAARQALRMQKGLSGRPINVTPAYLLVPANLEEQAEQIVAVIYAPSVDDVNVFSGRLKVLVDPRLDAKSVTRWYMTADPAQFDGLHFAYLEGQEGPQVESRIGFEVDGVQVRVRLDFGAAFVDWRGWYMNSGV